MYLELYFIWSVYVALRWITWRTGWLLWRTLLPRFDLKGSTRRTRMRRRSGAASSGVYRAARRSPPTRSSSASSTTACASRRETAPKRPKSSPRSSSWRANRSRPPSTSPPPTGWVPISDLADQYLYGVYATRAYRWLIYGRTGILVMSRFVQSFHCCSWFVWFALDLELLFAFFLILYTFYLFIDAFHLTHSLLLTLLRMYTLYYECTVREYSNSKATHLTHMPFLNGLYRYSTIHCIAGCWHSYLHWVLYFGLVI